MSHIFDVFSLKVLKELNKKTTTKHCMWRCVRTLDWSCMYGLLPIHVGKCEKKKSKAFLETFRLSHSQKIKAKQQQKKREKEKMRQLFTLLPARPVTKLVDL